VWSLLDWSQGAEGGDDVTKPRTKIHHSKFGASSEIVCSCVFLLPGPNCCMSIDDFYGSSEKEYGVIFAYKILELFSRSPLGDTRVGFLMEQNTGGIRPNSRMQRNRTRHHFHGCYVCSPALIIMIFIPVSAFPQEIVFLKKYGHPVSFCIKRVVPARF